MSAQTQAQTILEQLEAHAEQMKSARDLLKLLQLLLKFKEDLQKTQTAGSAHGKFSGIYTHTHTHSLTHSHLCLTSMAQTTDEATEQQPTAKENRRRSHAEYAVCVCLCL